MISLCAAQTIRAAEINVNSDGRHTGGGFSCAKLLNISVAESGNIAWSFKRNGYHAGGGVNHCKNAKIKLAKTQPPESIRGVLDLNKDGSFRESFVIFTTPTTASLGLVSISHINKSGIAWYGAQKEIALLLEIDTAGDWMSNFTASESQLKETKAADKTPPTIRILSPVAGSGQVPRVDTYTGFVRGQVTDDQGVMNILVNGKKVGIKEDGSFAAKIKLGVGRNDVLVQAEDINNNVAETKLTIIREEFISEQTLVDVDMPPKTSMNNPDALAVVIGVESYQYVPDATYAYNDAEVFREYLAETMGMKRQRIKLATNSKATQAELSKLLGPNGWLARNITKGKSDVVVYFSGHGIASPDAKSSGLLPHDVDPNYSVGLQTTQLYQDLAGMGAKSVTVFLDACFTGQTRNSEMLIANARPIVIKPLAAAIPDNVTVISAASGAQISGALEEKEHGLFTYYLLKGLGGDADSNKDKSINISELKSFVFAKVKEQAALNGREQTPESQGSSDNVLVRF